MPPDFSSIGKWFAFGFLGTVVAVYLSTQVASAISSRKRTRSLQDYAERHGLEMFPQDKVPLLSSMTAGEAKQITGSSIARQLNRMFNDFQPFGIGYSMFLWNSMVGVLPFGTFYAFDYAYTEGDTRHSCRFMFGVVAFRVPFDFLRLSMQHESLNLHVERSISDLDIQFESNEFNRKYFVTSDDPKFAYDILHPQMISYLLDLPILHWQLFGPYIVLIKQKGWSVKELEEIPDIVEKFLDLIPDYVEEDYGIEPEWTTPFEPVSGALPVDL